MGPVVLDPGPVSVIYRFRSFLKFYPVPLFYQSKWAATPCQVDPIPSEPDRGPSGRVRQRGNRAPFRAGPGSWQRLTQGPALWLIPVFAVIGVFLLYPILDAPRLAFTVATLVSRGESFLRAVHHRVFGSAFGTILRNTAVFYGASVVLQHLPSARHRPSRRARRAQQSSRDAGPAHHRPCRLGHPWHRQRHHLVDAVLRIARSAPSIRPSDFEHPHRRLALHARQRHDVRGDRQCLAGHRLFDDRALRGDQGHRSVRSTKPPPSTAPRAWDRFRFITLPAVPAALLVNAILITIQTLNTFDSIISLTGGGPGPGHRGAVALHLQPVFDNFDLAGGSVLSIILLSIEPVSGPLYALFLPREEEIAMDFCAARGLLGNLATYLVATPSLDFSSCPHRLAVSLALRTPQEIFLAPHGSSPKTLPWTISPRSLPTPLPLYLGTGSNSQRSVPLAPSSSQLRRPAPFRAFV